jgi:pyridoxamine 5'-phosphate oxidase
MTLAELRRHYRLETLNKADLEADPIRQFESWLNDAVNAQTLEPNAMTLATADASGKPSARTVLLKGLDARGFVFYTNYESRKARELDANPYAALVFNWLLLERQVRVEGSVVKVSREESEAYFKSRPLGSRLGAWASRQSRVIAGHEVLQEELARLKARYPDGEVPLPPFWGGYRLRPVTIEFWQGRPDRLHDRFRYSRQGDADGDWTLARLAP